MRPIVGIVGKFGKAGRDYMLIDNDVRQAILDCGALPIGVMSPQPFAETDKPYEETEAELREVLGEQLAMCQGIVLQGGQRIARYEYELARIAYERDVPTLGICRGQTIMARALGAEIVDVDTEVHNQPGEKYAHKIDVVPGSKFCEIVRYSQIFVNSRHVRAVRPSEIFRTGAFSPDGYAEVIEAPEKKFYLGTRFHPENLYQHDLTMREIFQAFVRAVAEV